MSPHHDLLADLRRLGLSAGAPPEALKPAWRRAVSRLHPDRRGDAPEDPALAEVNAAFKRLEQFARLHGRLPGIPVRAEVVVRPALTRERRRRPWVLALLVLGVAVFVFWPQPPAPTEPPWKAAPHEAGTVHEASAPTSEDPNPHDDPRLTLGPPTPVARVITVGASTDEVERLAGAPLFRSDARWTYGPSEVRFESGRVTGWYSSPLRPLPVDTPTADALR